MGRARSSPGGSGAPGAHIADRAAFGSSLWALLAAAILVLIANAAVPVAVTAAFDEGYRDRVSCQLAQLDPLTVDDLLATAQGAGGRTVWWIGDSIVYSRDASLVGSPKRLERELQRRFGSDVHVFNAALPAARTADKYAVLLRILETRPALIIFQEKYLEFSRAQVEGLPMRYPYLNSVIATDPDYAAHYASFNAYALTPLIAAPPPLAVASARMVDQSFSVYRFRGLIQRLVVRGDLFSRLNGKPAESAIPAIDGPMCRGFNPVARDPGSFTGAYQSGPFDAFPNAGLYFADRAAVALGASGVPSLAYVAALNHRLLGALAAGPTFDKNTALVSSVWSGRAFPFRDYSGLSLDDALFLDTEHLTDLGHQSMVDRLLDDFGAVFGRALGRQ